MCTSQKKRKNIGVFLSEFYDVITGSWMTAGIGSALVKEARISIGSIRNTNNIDNTRNINGTSKYQQCVGEQGHYGPVKCP